MYWSIIGTFITVFVGTLVSYCTNSKEDTYEAKLLHPLIVRCLNFMPGEPRKFKPGTPNPTPASVDAITVDITSGQDNFAFVKEGAEKTEEKKMKNQRISNMTKVVEEVGEEEEKEEGNQKKATESDKRIQDTFYSPETTGVYKRCDTEC